MNSTTRREFLKGSAATFFLTSLGSFPLFAEEELKVKRSSKEKVLVIVQLQGGNDGLNTVIPYTNPLYAENRRVLYVPSQEVLRLNEEVGFHPSFQGLHQLFKKGQVAVVQGVGYPFPNRSHFRSAEIWETAKPETEDTRTGWVGRCADLWASQGASKFTACSIGDQEQPLSTVGLKAAPPTIRDAHSFRILANASSDHEKQSKLQLLKELAQIERTSSSLEFVRQQTSAAFMAADSVESVLQSDIHHLGDSELGQKLGLVSAMIRGGIGTRIYHVSMPGFDTHSDQRDGHSVLLRQLDEAVSAFFESLNSAKLSDQVSLLIYSEFGRRVRENRSGGTDHGAAAPVILVSGGIRGGVIGKHPPLDDLDDGDLKMHTDFRTVYSNLIGGWLQLDATKVLQKRYPHLPLF